MPKPNRGMKANAGKSAGKFVSWNDGLTDEDKQDLLEIEDHTNEVIEAMDRAIARGLEAIGIEAETDAARICPVDTGRLRNSITHTIEDDGDEQSTLVGTNVEYAKYVHYGTHKTKAQPFLTDAVTNNVSKYERILAAAFESEEK